MIFSILIALALIHHHILPPFITKMHATVVTIPCYYRMETATTVPSREKSHPLQRLLLLVRRTRKRSHTSFTTTATASSPFTMLNTWNSTTATKYYHPVAKGGELERDEKGK